MCTPSNDEGELIVLYLQLLSGVGRVVVNGCF